MYRTHLSWLGSSESADFGIPESAAQHDARAGGDDRGDLRVPRPSPRPAPPRRDESASTGRFQTAIARALRVVPPRPSRATGANAAAAASAQRHRQRRSHDEPRGSRTLCAATYSSKRLRASGRVRGREGERLRRGLRPVRPHGTPEQDGDQEAHARVQRAHESPVRAPRGRPSRRSRCRTSCERRFTRPRRSPRTSRGSAARGTMSKLLRIMDDEDVLPDTAGGGKPSSRRRTAHGVPGGGGDRERLERAAAVRRRGRPERGVRVDVASGELEVHEARARAARDAREEGESGGGEGEGGRRRRKPPPPPRRRRCYRMGA